MKKNSLFPLLILVLMFPLFSAVTITMNKDYSRGETIIAKISGSFAEPLTEENIFFYRGYVEVPFDFSLAKIDSDYYISTSSYSKEPNNYILKLESVKYNEFGQLKEGDFSANFTISNKTADFSITPGFITTNLDFEITIENFLDSALELNLDLPEGITSEKTVSLSPAEIKILSFSLSRINSSLTDELKISSDNTEYVLPIYIYGQEIITGECGNGRLESGEKCDGSNFGDIDSCKDFHYDKGSLKCSSECEFNTSLCYKEECDRDSECAYNQFCKNDECLKKECSSDSDCDDDEECSHYECVISGCNEDSDCEDSDYYCLNDDCVLKECKKNTECENNTICTKWECVLKEGGCSVTADCNDSTKICNKGVCIKKVSFETCSGDGGEFCSTGYECNGDSKDIDGADCCLGTCIEKKNSSSKILGWGLIILVVIVLAFLYFKYRNYQKGSPDLAKIGGLKK